MNKAEYMEYHEAACKRMIEITKAKNADYSGAGDDPFSNFRQIEHLIKTVPRVVMIGMLTRMSDKMSRIASFVEKGNLQVKDESVKDTLLDVANYAILFMGIIEEANQRELNDAQFKNKRTPGFCEKCDASFDSAEFKLCQLADCPTK